MTFESDSEAEHFLKDRGFKFNRGVIRPPTKGHIESIEESEALDYLWLEWDYTYVYEE
jgi:hypothetical protein